MIDGMGIERTGITEYMLRVFIAESNKIERIHDTSVKVAEDTKWMKEWLKEEKPSVG